MMKEKSKSRHVFRMVFNYRTRPNRKGLCNSGLGCDCLIIAADVEDAIKRMKVRWKKAERLTITSATDIGEIANVMRG